MDDFTKGYIEAALWSTAHEGCPIEATHSVKDIDPGDLKKIEQECEEFQITYAPLLTAYCAQYRPLEHFTVIECAGHDFWLTRAHHGAGFWDRSLGELGDLLTAAAQSYREVEFYVGNDGKVYCE